MKNRRSSGTLGDQECGPLDVVGMFTIYFFLFLFSSIVMYLSRFNIYDFIIHRLAVSLIEKWTALILVEYSV